MNHWPLPSRIVVSSPTGKSLDSPPKGESINGEWPRYILRFIGSMDGGYRTESGLEIGSL
jgi:hypothetical protein